MFNINNTDEYFKFGSYGPHKEYKLLLDNKKAEGSKILAETKLKYDKGPEMPSDEEIEIKLIRLEGMLNKINSELDDEFQFMFYFSLIYTTIIRYWFELNRKWPLQPKEAFVYIKENEPKFYELLKKIISNIPNTQKVTYLNEVKSLLFKD